jgi:hypothetical protein
MTLSESADATARETDGKADPRAERLIADLSAIFDKTKAEVAALYARAMSEILQTWRESNNDS